MLADFSYDQGATVKPRQLSVTVIGDRAAVRDELRDDALEAGLRLRGCTSFADHVAGGDEDCGGGKRPALGDLLLVDCGHADATAMAALSRLDSLMQSSGANLIVTTTLDALDAVFGCLAFSEAQILVEPSRAERAIALGRVLAQAPSSRVRELAADDRLMLLRLSEQVGSIAQRLDTLGPKGRADGGAARLESPAQAWRGQDQRPPMPLAPPLPDAASIRAIIRQRQARAKFFDAQLFADPAWDILLDLAAARAEGRTVSVTSLCVAAAVPATTALRWIGQLVEAGVLLRVADPDDRRRVNIALADGAADRMARYFSDTGIRSERPLREVG